MLDRIVKVGKKNSLQASLLNQTPVEEEEPDDSMFDLEPPPLKIKNFDDAIHSLENVRSFLDTK